MSDDLRDLWDELLLEVPPPSLTDARGFDWDDLDASTAPDTMPLLPIDPPNVRKQVNVRRRACETERLRKHSWIRSPVKGQGKRTKYVYTRSDGTQATSLREALRQCRKVQSV